MNANDLFKSWENAIDRAISHNIAQHETSQLTLTKTAAVNIHTNLKAGKLILEDAPYTCTPLGKQNETYVGTLYERPEGVLSSRLPVC